MTYDTRTNEEKCMVKVEALKDEGGAFYYVHVDNGNRIIKGLTHDQAEAVCGALRLAQAQAIRNALFRVRDALGIERK